KRRIVGFVAVAVVVAFFICWAPFHAQRLVATHVSFPSNADDRIKYLKIYEVVTYISGVLYFVSTTINPLLYNIMSNKFRDAFKETFARCCRLNTGKQRTYSVLSRSRSSAPRATESNESRDEASSVQTHTSITHKSSIDSGLGMHITTKRPRKIEFPNRSEVSITMMPLTNLTHISPSTKLVAVHVKHAPEPNWRFLEFFRCLGSKRQEPASPEFRVRTKETRLSADSFDISNSSLKEVEAALLKDELTTYMNKPSSIN
ncbi:PREDICTED: neuropeptides capa receptor-like, partial [Nicrophorus vespilloides]|uniref:Neuropeptides capa receptor-like n=1 Tax=Nicrophorus vespilloides TaxID=110193 RepID=A0ABM1M9E5_NICVS